MSGLGSGSGGSIKKESIPLTYTPHIEQLIYIVFDLAALLHNFKRISYLL